MVRPEWVAIVSEVEARLIEVRLEAAFDRYNRAAISGVEPTLELFVEALRAEGLALSLAATRTSAPTARAGNKPEKRARAGSVPVGRRLEGVLARRVRGLP
jgi:hypothetical protein